MSYRIAIACGGTGGHIMPGLATAIALRGRGHQVALWMTGKAAEKKALSEWDGEVIEVPAQGLPNQLSVRGLVRMVQLFKAVMRCRQAMKLQRPDVVLGMGSYVTVGPALAALWLGIPYVLHEANTIPGRAVRMLAKGAYAVATCFEQTSKQLPAGKARVTGMPLRSDLEERAKALSASGLQHRGTGLPGAMGTGLAGDAGTGLRLLVMGGSAGAHRLNEVVSDALVALRAAGGGGRVTHLTGAADEAWVAERYREAGVEAYVHAFTADMATIYASVDAAICRSGASTCAELALFGVPALLVPYPYATHNHQYVNALAMQEQGAADVVVEAELTVEGVTQKLESWQADPSLLAGMRAAMQETMTSGAAERLADLVEEAAGTGLAGRRSRRGDRSANAVGTGLQP